MRKVMMKCGGLRMGLALALVVTLTPTNAAAQAPAGGVTKEEEVEARAAAAAFAGRLRATQGYPAGTRLYKDFAPNAYTLRLVRVGGAMKVVHAGLPQDLPRAVTRGARASRA